MLGNGSDDIIGMLTCGFLEPGDEAILPHPSFLMYEIMILSAGAIPVVVPLKQLSIDLQAINKSITSKTRMAFLVQSQVIPPERLFLKKDFENFLKKIPPGSDCCGG